MRLRSSPLFLHHQMPHSWGLISCVPIVPLSAPLNMPKVVPGRITFYRTSNHTSVHTIHARCTGLADALNWLHSRITLRKGQDDVSCVHMDLKPANILIMRDERSAVGMWKISDFGISEVRRRGDEMITESSQPNITRETAIRSTYGPGVTMVHIRLLKYRRLCHISTLFHHLPKKIRVSDTRVTCGHLAALLPKSSHSPLVDLSTLRHLLEPVKRTTAPMITSMKKNANKAA